jgi:hypothetical protein
MQFELTGKIKSILPTQSGHGKNGEWVKNSFVIEYSDNGYVQQLCLDVIGADKWDKMKSSIVVGNDVSCKFSVSSREWNNKYFTSCNCWYCSSLGNLKSSLDSSNSSSTVNQSSVDDSNDNLPF